MSSTKLYGAAKTSRRIAVQCKEAFFARQPSLAKVLSLFDYIEIKKFRMASICTSTL
jgi:hypothetical protein